MEPTNKSKKSKKKKSKGVFRKILITFITLVILVGAVGTGVVLAVIKSAPAIDSDIINNLKQSSDIYDKDGEYISALVDPNTGKRTIVQLDKIPKHLQEAFISIEDERFYQHHGIDVKRILGALWHDVITLSVEQGGSTITQQLMKNYALTQEKTLPRKIQEAYLAIQLERKLSKEQILTAYLNTIYLGGNFYGVQAASLNYFGKDVEELDVAESALIAGLNQNPAKYDPYSKKNQQNPDIYLNRQRTVLKKMYQLGYLNKDEYDKAYNEKLVFQKKQGNYTMSYQWFVEPAIKQVVDDFSKQYGLPKNEAQQKLRTGGYKIYLTLDQNIQKKTEEVISDDKRYPKLKDKDMSMYALNSKDEKLPQPQGAAVVMDGRTGEVRAVVGGRGKHPLMSNSKAVDLERQPGSSIKPLTVYGPGIENGVITPATLVVDEPMSIGNHSFNNYNNKFSGSVTVREAIRNSINIPAVKVLQMVGINNSYKFAKEKLHLSTLVPADRNVSPLALGGLTEGVTPLEMAAAYTVYVNGGIYSEPMFYTKVVDSKGNTVLERKPKQERAMSPQASYIMDDMLKTVVQSGTGTKARLGAMPAGGKTGTSENHGNGWFVGFTPYYSCVVWMGHELQSYPITSGYWIDSKGVRRPPTANMDLVGGTCAPLWKDIMLEAHKGLAVKDFQRPSGIVNATVCLESGKLASDKCTKTANEIFIEGTQPVEICTTHEIIPPIDGGTETPGTTTP